MLVATDIAARVYVDDVELVVHTDPPAEHKAPLGRTAQAGATRRRHRGAAEQRRDTQALLRKAGITVTA